MDNFKYDTKNGVVYRQYLTVERGMLSHYCKFKWIKQEFGLQGYLDNPNFDGTNVLIV